MMNHCFEQAIFVAFIHVALEFNNKPVLVDFCVSS